MVSYSKEKETHPIVRETPGKTRQKVHRVRENLAKGREKHH
jgi:hypothetical protein